MRVLNSLLTVLYPQFFFDVSGFWKYNWFVLSLGLEMIFMLKEMQLLQLLLPVSDKTSEIVLWSKTD